MDQQQYTYKLTKEDYLRGVLLSIKPSRTTQVMLSYVFIFFVIMFLVVIYFSIRLILAWQLLIPSMLIPLFYLIWRFILLPMQVNRIYNQQKELDKPIDVEISKDELITSNKYGHNKRPWSDFIKWKENENLFLLYHSDVLQTLIPKRIFTNEEQVNSFRQRLTENIAPRKESISFRTPIAIIILIIIIFIMFLSFRTLVP